MRYLPEMSAQPGSVTPPPGRNRQANQGYKILGCTDEELLTWDPLLVLEDEEEVK
jgi:hypothetical protein